MQDIQFPLGFVHIPKTAGTSLTTSLIEALQPRRAVGGFDRSLFGDFDDFGSLTEAAMRYVYLEPVKLPADADFVAGHFSLSTIRARYPSATVLTILREPRSRLLSHWVFWRSEAEMSQPELGSWGEYLKASHRRFADFLTERKIAGQIDNVATRLLLGPHPLIPTSDFIKYHDDAALIADAQAELASLSFVNVIENPRLSDELARWLNRPFQLARVKETKPVPRRCQLSLEHELTPAALDAWEARSRLDWTLWS